MQFGNILIRLLVIVNAIVALTISSDTTMSGDITPITEISVMNNVYLSVWNSVSLIGPVSVSPGGGLYITAPNNLPSLDIELSSDFKNMGIVSFNSAQSDLSSKSILNADLNVFYNWHQVYFVGSEGPPAEISFKTTDFYNLGVIAMYGIRSAASDNDIVAFESNHFENSGDICFYNQDVTMTFGAILVDGGCFHIQGLSRVTIPPDLTRTTIYMEGPDAEIFVGPGDFIVAGFGGGNHITCTDTTSGTLSFVYDATNGLLNIGITLLGIFSIVSSLHIGGSYDQQYFSINNGVVSYSQPVPNPDMPAACNVCPPVPVAPPLAVSSSSSYSSTAETYPITMYTTEYTTKDENGDNIETSAVIIESTDSNGQPFTSTSYFADVPLTTYTTTITKIDANASPITQTAIVIESTNADGTPFTTTSYFQQTTDTLYTTTITNTAEDGIVQTRTAVVYETTDAAGEIYYVTSYLSGISSTSDVSSVSYTSSETTPSVVLTSSDTVIESTSSSSSELLPSSTIDTSSMVSESSSEVTSSSVMVSSSRPVESSSEFTSSDIVVTSSMVVESSSKVPSSGEISSSSGVVESSSEAVQISDSSEVISATTDIVSSGDVILSNTDIKSTDSTDGPITSYTTTITTSNNGILTTRTGNVIESTNSDGDSFTTTSYYTNKGPYSNTTNSVESSDSIVTTSKDMFTITYNSDSPITSYITEVITTDAGGNEVTKYATVIECTDDNCSTYTTTSSGSRGDDGISSTTIPNGDIPQINTIDESFAVSKLRPFITMISSFFVIVFSL